MAQYYLDLIPISALQVNGPEGWWQDSPFSGYHALDGSTWNYTTWTVQYSSDDLVRVGVTANNSNLADDDDAGQKVETTADPDLIAEKDPITNEYELDVEIDGTTYRLVAVSSGDDVIGFTFDGAWPPADTPMTSVMGSSEDIQELDDPQPAPGEDPFPATSDPETGDGPIWMWIGNESTQFNATPETNLTAAEADNIVGYGAAGPNEIKPVDMDGQILGSNFQTTFNPTYGINAGYGGTDMSYVSPQTGTRVEDAHMTTAVISDIEVWDLDENGEEYLVGTFPGVVIQMDNGDVFFRPHADYVDAWDGVTSLYRIEVVSTERLSGGGDVTYPTNAINPVVGFNPEINDIDIIPCFARGMMIATPSGEIPVEQIAVGDIVLTVDHGPQPVRWIGSRRLSRATLNAAPNLRPIRIHTGALGSGVPAADLVVSPQHRVLVRSRIAQRMFGTTEILVAAKQLLQLEGIDIADDLAEVEYFHILFDRHEVVLSNGAETESLYTGPMALKSVGRQALEEIFAIFPELRETTSEPSSARPLASGRQARKLAIRHLQNGKKLVSEMRAARMS